MLEPERKCTIGWFSESAAEIYGTVVWEDEAGREVVCTQVSCTLDEPHPGDARVVSETLRRYVRGRLNVVRTMPRVPHA